MNWYALHVRSNFERLVAGKLHYEGVEAFYPVRFEVSRDERRQVEKKFMPGYVFARFDLEDKTPVVAIPQVVSILGWGRHAVAIPEREIVAVQMIAQSKDAKACEYLAEGARVRIARGGSYEGLEGFVLKTRGKTRVVVSITTIARSMSLEVDASSLEPIAVELPKAA